MVSGPSDYVTGTPVAVADAITAGSVTAGMIAAGTVIAGIVDATTITSATVDGAVMNITGSPAGVFIYPGPRPRRGT